MRKTMAGMVLLALCLGLGACNNETPTAKVGSGSGETNNAGATSGRVSTQDEAQKAGGG